MFSFLVVGVFLSCVTRSEKPDIIQTDNTQYPRVVAIGDLHADLDTAIAVLKMASLIDENLNWIGEKTVVVQTGDLTDRGADGKETLELIKRIQKEAQASGGAFISLLGNHEAMNIVGDWRYVSKGDIESFGGVENRKKEFAEGGAWRDWMLKQKVATQIEGTIFVHGGISEKYAALGMDEINKQALTKIARGERGGILGSEGPLWYRAYLQAPESIACAELDRTLKLLNGSRMVVGHTTQRTGKIAVRCGGKLLGIDTGISDHYGRNLAFVEFVHGDAIAIYPNRKENIMDPK